MIKVSEKNYQELLIQLYEGKISELTISASEFMAFQQAYVYFAHRKKISGRALKKGGAVFTKIAD